MIFDEDIKNFFLGYCQLSKKKILVVKLRGNHFNVAIIFVYIPTTQSSEEETETFYSTVGNGKAYWISPEITIVTGVLNFNVDNERDGEIVEKSELGTCNGHREKWVQWCIEKDQVEDNTWFQEQ